MFLFIYLAHITGFTLMLFKYISCSYLSFFPALSCCIFRSLNTSHVLIYLILDKNGSVAGRLFKYISCSYLSQIHSDFRTSILLFKYISCSYLSHVFKPFFNLIYLFSPLNSSVSQNFTSRLSFFLLNQLYLVLTCINTPLFRLKQ